MTLFVLNCDISGQDCNKVHPENIFDIFVILFKFMSLKSGIDIKGDAAAMQRVKDEAEKAKKELSSATSTDINLPFLSADADGPKHFEYTLTRAKMEELVAPLLDKSRLYPHRILYQRIGNRIYSSLHAY